MNYDDPMWRWESETVEVTRFGSTAREFVDAGGRWIYANGTAGDPTYTVTYGSAQPSTFDIRTVPMPGFSPGVLAFPPKPAEPEPDPLKLDQPRRIKLR